MSDPRTNLAGHLQVGDLLVGRYRIDEPIGAGAFGAIFGAVDRETGERVAVKALPPDSGGSDGRALARFRREMKIIGALVHRHVVGLYDFGHTDAGVLYMILEYIDGLPLDRVVAGNPMVPHTAVAVCTQIASALALAHDRGVIHRDLKPANVMLCDRPDGFEVKVLDFGIAKLLGQIDDDAVVPLTREGIAVGTPRYIAPEQARGRQVGPWTDLYALGLLFYEMLTGARAVKADDVDAAVSAHVAAEPLTLDELDDVDQPCRPVLFELIEKDPRKRIRSAQTLLAKLDGLARHYGDGFGAAGQAGLDPQRGRVVGPPEPASAAVQPPRRRRPDVPGRTIGDELRDVGKVELDRQNDVRHAPASGDPAAPRPRQPPRAPVLRLPDNVYEWVETLVAPLVAGVGFVLLTAQLPMLPFDVRLGVGLAPSLAGVCWAVLSGRRDWRHSLFRLVNLFSLAAILVAHALGPQQLINGLFRQPTWFLAPIDDIAPMDGLRSVLTWSTRRYGVMLSSAMKYAESLL